MNSQIEGYELVTCQNLTEEEITFLRLATCKCKIPKEEGIIFGVCVLHSL